MDAADITTKLNTFASWSHAFTLEELVDFADSEVDPEELRCSLFRDDRFICPDSVASDQKHFIPKRTLFRWFTHLSLRLALADKARLNERQLALAMGSLRLHGQWTLPPPEAVEFGRCFGFCGPAWTAGEYIFPVAKILSFVPAVLAKRAFDILDDLTEAEDLNPHVVLLEAVEKGLSRLTTRQARVLQAREGLQEGKRMTLEQIGKPLRLTRERVRQIEEKAWGKIHHPLHRDKAMFVVALLRYVLLRQGSLIVGTDSPDINVLSFVCKAAGAPQAALPDLGLMILGTSPKDVEDLESLWSFPEVMDAEALASRFDLESHLSLLAADLIVISERVAHICRGRLNKAQKVYLALRDIGGLAHYSAVAEAYNRLSPDDLSTERNVHAVLSRGEYGVVWVGAKGTFGLKERGYERPSKGIFDAVTEIVEERYQATGRPVPFTVIAAEIGKYRRVVKSSSLTFAAHCNPNLRRVSKDSFVPRPPGDDEQEEIAAEELDKILRDFESTQRS